MATTGGGVALVSVSAALLAYGFKELIARAIQAITGSGNATLAADSTAPWLVGLIVAIGVLLASEIAWLKRRCPKEVRCRGQHSGSLLWGSCRSTSSPDCSSSYAATRSIRVGSSGNGMEVIRRSALGAIVSIAVVMMVGCDRSRTDSSRTSGSAAQGLADLARWTSRSSPTHPTPGRPAPRHQRLPLSIASYKQVLLSFPIERSDDVDTEPVSARIRNPTAGRAPVDAIDARHLETVTDEAHAEPTAHTTHHVGPQTSSLVTVRGGSSGGGSVRRRGQDIG